MLLTSQILVLIGLIFNVMAAIYLTTRVFTKISSISNIFENEDTKKLLSISRELSDLQEDSLEFSKKIRDNIIILNEIVNRNVIDFNFASFDTYKRAKKGIIFLIIGVTLQGTAVFIALLIFKR